MKIILLITLFILSSCSNEGSKGKKDKKQEEVRCLCTPFFDWQINSSAVNFPKNFMIKHNAFDIKSTCRHNDIKITELADQRKLIEFREAQSGFEGMNIEIVDLGESCDNAASYYIEDEAHFERTLIQPDPAKPLIYKVKVMLNN